jgi:hypothetical protein
MMFNRATLIVALCLMLSPSRLPALQESNQENDNKPELLTLQVLVTDPDGEPVENATVFCTGLRTKVRRGDHWGWSEDRFGPLPKPETNSEGLVDLPYPKYVSEEIEVGTVTVSVEHPDFVTFRQDRSVDDVPAKVELKRGFRIAATAVDAVTGEPIKQDLYGLVSGNSRLQDWKLAENGMLVSPVFEPQVTWFRMIKIVPDEPALFSELINIDPADRSRVLLRDIKLSKGTRVVGRLDESVQRPIKNGTVAAWIVRPGEGDLQHRLQAKWTWYDKTLIAEDGTFVFESLPTGEILQMIPICDDWVPRNPTQEEVLPFYPEEADRVGSWATQPQLIRLEGDLVEPVLKMMPATSVRITVVDQNDQPLPGVKVASWPNQLWFDGGSQILGSAFSLTDWLVQTRRGEEMIIDRTNRFAATTDKNGVAVIRTMPPNRTEGLVADLEGYEMPLNGTEREIRIDLKPDIVTEVTIRLQPVGTEILKDKSFRSDAEEDEHENTDGEEAGDDGDENDSVESDKGGKVGEDRM